jgi:hypothetical protein
LAGYNIILTGGSMTTNLTTNGSFNVTLNWRNRGLAPTYDAWKIRYQLRNASTNAVVQTFNSAYRLFDLKPSGGSTSVSENFTLSSVPAGTYNLHVIVQDSVNYMDPFFIMINGRQSDGSYILRSNITVASGGGGPVNTPPTANAGTDRELTLPNSSVNLSGSGSDIDGIVVGYAWTKVSGPSGGAITSPSSANTSITGLQEGTYVYRLTVTDDDGATATDDVQVFVYTVVDTNNPPVANAGPDQEITLPTNTVTFNGSGTDPDGRIVQLQWEKVSGPSGGTISSPGSANPFTSDMVAGTYVYRLTVTDDDGATDTDDMQVLVNPAPEVPADGEWIFNGTPNPVEANDNTGTGITVGVKFMTNQSGAVVRMRFWKTANNTGTHTAGVWDSEGNLLATATFTGETASGWQYATLSDTVWVFPGQVYLAAYFSPTGVYSKTDAGLQSTVSGNFMYAPAAGLVGGNGMYYYSFALTYPTDTYQGNSYWVDVEYVDALSPEPPPNQNPTVDAGNDKSLRLPTTSVQLSCVATDPDGTVVSYRWQQISGPKTVTFSDSLIINPLVSGMDSVGVYSFLVTVTDDDGAQDTDIVAVAVDGARLNWGRRKRFTFKSRTIKFRR